MAVVTRFGALFVDDRIALERWLAAHDLRHTAYLKRFSVPCSPLKGPVTGNWMLHHSLAHEALAHAMKDSRASNRLLAMPDKWRTEEELSTWHALHDQLHKFIEGVMAHGS
jgi:hypothetical protein